MNGSHIVVALSVATLCLLPLAACGGAQTTGARTSSGATRQSTAQAKPETKTDDQTDAQQERQADATPQADVDPQTVIDSLQVGSDGSSDTMNAVPHDGMYDIWTGCMPQNQVDGVGWVTGPQSEYIRLTSSDGQLPAMFDCLASATGMTDDARASVTGSQDGQWHVADWDGYQAIWQRSGTSTDVVVRLR